MTTNFLPKCRFTLTSTLGFLVWSFDSPTVEAFLYSADSSLPWLGQLLGGSYAEIQKVGLFFGWLVVCCFGFFIGLFGRCFCCLFALSVIRILHTHTHTRFLNQTLLQIPPPPFFFFP